MDSGLTSDTLNRPLLLNTKSDTSTSIKFTWTLILQWVLYIIMWAIFLLWIGLIVLHPAQFMRHFLKKWQAMTEGTYFGFSGSLLLLFCVPVLAIAFLGIIYIKISPKENNENRKSKLPRPHSWTFPVLIDGPFGVVSAAELIVIVLFVVFILVTMSIYLIRDSKIIEGIPLPSTVKRWVMLESAGLQLGSVGLFCLGFLFLPVARGSVLLRLIDIPFEHATKYHVWLGHVTMALFTAHGLCYLVAWTLEGRLLHEVVQWQSIGIANLPGEISLCAGLAMWVTSLQLVRQYYFELFFYTHQLYIIFVVFLALHVGDFIFCMAAAGIFIFVLDRFLRFCQSRKDVGVLSAMALPCGTVELVLSKPPGLRYNALSFVFLQIRNLSWLEWHPFSVSSSPYDGRNHLSVLIKPLGKWTQELKNIISMNSEQPQKALVVSHAFKMNASVEGPYGHEADYHLSYSTLILVAGGIGISPFVAILRDLFHRLEQGQSCVPTNVWLIWAVKKSKELYILDLVDAESICPGFANKISLEVQVYVTQESEPALENGDYADDIHCISYPEMRRKPMSSLVGTGNIIWAGIYMASSIIGFVVTMGLTNTFFINPYGSAPWWLKGLCLILCMVMGVVIFGGLAVVLWDLWECRICKYQGESEDRKDSRQDVNILGRKNLIASEGVYKLVNPSNTHYGHRPDFREIFGAASNHWKNVDVGVLVCGPQSLQTSVASECRTYNLSNSKNRVVFHFNSHSFDL
eukprot:Gb_14298 [translate_table: standard]